MPSTMKAETPNGNKNVKSDANQNLKVVQYDNDDNVAPVGTEEDPLHVEVDEIVDVTVTSDDLIPSAIGDGRKTVTLHGTAEKLTTTATPCQYVIITAIATNTGVVVVGGSTVVAAAATRRGKPLTVSSSVGESVTIPIDDVSKVYVDSTVDGEGVVYTYVN